MRAPRTRACLVPPRSARSGSARHGVRTRTERFLVGAATVLCSAVVVVVLGLLADASAARVDVPVDGVPISSAPVSPVSAWSEPGAVAPSGVDGSR